MTLKERLDQLEERERKLLLIFAGVLGVMILLLAPVAVAMSVSSQRSENDRIREIIQTIEDERLLLGRRQADSKLVETRYARKTPALAGYLAQLADQVGVDIPETQDRSTIPHGKTFKERSTKIRLRQVGMYDLSNFMEKLAHSGYPVAISKLNIKKRGTKMDEFDVEMDVSAFDREASKKKPAAPSKPGTDSEEEE